MKGWTHMSTVSVTDQVGRGTPPRPRRKPALLQKLGFLKTCGVTQTYSWWDLANRFASQLAPSVVSALTWPCAHMAKIPLLVPQRKSLQRSHKRERVQIRVSSKFRGIQCGIYSSQVTSKVILLRFSLMKLDP